ncbi:MAG: amidohydrolase family protein [Actinomycetota bacterium]|jgi:5-methylthioadenosine/S-adenosylhomocysteine deaminase|nr:amidohydrolase family protein [Actinomycetota bacterium]|tara:strand:- start:1075 stop:2397 length:1323 start_codon:yes stop_codon:yes gene_type:complete
MPSGGGLIIQPDWLITESSEKPKRHWGLRICDGKIFSVGPNEKLENDFPEDKVFTAREKVLMPGFVNGHTHMYGVLAHGIPLESAPSDFWSFLESFWWPLVEDKIDHEMISAATEWLCSEMLLTGTTTFCDILEAPFSLPDSLIIEKEIVNNRGLRALLSFEATERSGSDIALKGIDENIRLIEAAADDDLVSGLMSVHTTFTCSDDFLRQAFEIAESHNALFHAHCNEGSYEGEWCEKTYGHRTFEHYEQLGINGSRFLASQCVHLSDKEVELIANAGTRCVHMPLSNCEVGGGIAPIPELLEKGVTVGLGSDGYINDMFEVMRSAFLIHKARLQDPGVMNAAQVFDMATLQGAKALGFEDVGALQPDFVADLQLVDANFPTPLTEENLLEQLLLYRSNRHVDSVMVAGEWKMQNGEIIGVNIEDQRESLHRQTDRLWR